MKHLLIALAALFLSANVARSQEATLEGKWCLCEIQTFENDNLTGEMSVGKDYIEFRADGTCVMLASKAEKEYTFDPESLRLTIGARKATVVELTSEQLIWEEHTGSTTMRYRLIRTQ